MYHPKPFLSVRSGFNFNIRGYKVKDEVFFNSSTPSEIETVFSFVYLDIPLVAQFNLATDVESGGIFLRGGGYCGIAIRGGTAVRTDEDSPRLQTTAQDFTIGNSKSDLLREQDYGITVGGGLEFRTFEIALVWDVGLANISNDSSNGFYAQNRLFRIVIVVFALQ